MAAYEGAPSIRLEGDKDRALALVPDAKALLFRVQQFIKTAGVSTFSSSQRIGQDGYIYVLSSGDQHIIHISVDVDGVDMVSPEVPVPGDGTISPTFYSGLVFGGFLEQRTGAGGSYQVCTGFTPTPPCIAIHDELSAGRQSSKRLAVRPYFDDLQGSGTRVFSQYTLLRPSMYSGTMAAVVQVVMGLGRINKNALRDPMHPRAGRGYRDAVEARGVQVRYDYKFHRTHGITYGADGTPWLVEISQARGVIAMPLPMFPRSTTDGFREQAAARGDTPMVTALEEIGGLPTGESFPVSGDVLEERISDGTILRLISPEGMVPFYSNQPYSVNVGWAFNSRGTEAHNTGYRFGDDDVQRGVWYLVRLTIGALVQGRRSGDPIAVASAALVRQSEGFLFAPRARIGRYLPIKFYDPFLPGLRSHDGAPAAPTSINPRCDTVMFVCFVNDELKTVRFFRNPATDNIDETEDSRYPGECLYSGSWTITRTFGMRGFPTMMYTNDFDDREVLDTSVFITQIDSVDLGFDPPRFSDFIESPETSFVFRNKVFRRTTTQDLRNGPSLSSVVVVPEFAREMYYYAVGKQFDGGRTGSTAVTYDYLQDPNVGYSWRNFPRLNYPPWPTDIGCAIENCGGRVGLGNPHKERKIVCLDHQPYYCSDFADSGTWLTQCQVVDSFNTVPIPNRVPRYTPWNRGTDARASLHVVTRGHNGPIELPLAYSQFVNRWKVPSPDPETLIVQNLSAEYSAIGEDCVVYRTDLAGYGEIRTRGYIVEAVDNTLPCFIGVNHP